MIVSGIGPIPSNGNDTITPGRDFDHALFQILNRGALTTTTLTLELAVANGYVPVDVFWPIHNRLPSGSSRRNSVMP
jgi:hypothetical protein